jgi:hypothetical protein
MSNNDDRVRSPSTEPSGEQSSTSPAPGGQRAPSRTRRNPYYNTAPSSTSMGRTRSQSRPGSRYSSRPSTSLGRRRSGDMQQNPARDQDAIHTFLRIRPPPPGEEVDERHPYPSYLRVLSKSEVLLVPPEDDLKARNRVPEQFEFARVFPFNAQQQHLFAKTTLPLVQDLLKRGRDALVFAYGVTNSGKTYTVQGDQDDPGLLPRSLNVLFSTVGSRMTNLKMRPVRFCEVEMCDDLEEDSADTLLRNMIAAQPPTRPKRGARKEPPLSLSLLAEAVAKPGVLEPETVPVDERYRYSIWVSFAEIYTEKAYDLLRAEPVQTDKRLEPGQTEKRKNLLITHCPATGVKYMHGLREVHVKTLEEAYAVLEIGKRNRTVFSTLLNQTSSRSHSIFTIKLLKIPVDVTEETLLERLDEVAMCRMSIVDLAGQERNKRTHNTGQRLKEAGNINQSLMVLGQCLEALRYNQANPHKPMVVPYRHSKLTELFQGFFFGEGRAAMVVNLNPFDTNYHETSHVLRFAATAREVTMNKDGYIRRRRPTSRGTDFDDDYMYAISQSEDEGDEQDEYIESLLEQITELRQKWMEAEARLARREAEIREEMTELMNNKISQMELAFAERLRKELAAKEAAMPAKQEMVSQGGQTDGDVHDACNEEIARLRREIDDLLSRLAERDARIATLEGELEHVRIELSEMTQRRETADSLIVSLREELIHEREQADLARRTALEQNDALHEQIEAFKEELKSYQEKLTEVTDLHESEQRRVHTLQEELKASQAETAAERERILVVHQQLESLQAELDRVRAQAEEGRAREAAEAARIQALLAELSASKEETRSERERSDSVTRQLEELRQELSRERALAEEGRRGEAAEASRVQQLLRELDEAQQEIKRERQRAESFATKESDANTRVRELLTEIETVREQHRKEAEKCDDLMHQLDEARRDLLAEKARNETLTTSSEKRVNLLVVELETVRKEKETLERQLRVERANVQRLDQARIESEKLRADELARLRELLRQLEQACRETRDVKRERQIALSEVQILRDRLNRDRRRIKELRRELMRIDITAPITEINMTNEELVAELRRVIHASDVERKDYEARIDEYEAAALQSRIERQDLIERNEQMKKVLRKLMMDHVSRGDMTLEEMRATRAEINGTVPRVRRNNAVTPDGYDHENTMISSTDNDESVRAHSHGGMSSLRFHRSFTATDTFFRSLFHRRSKVPDIELSRTFHASSELDRSHDNEHDASTSVNSTTKRKSGLKRVVRALRGNGTARPQVFRRIGRAIRRKGKNKDTSGLDDSHDLSPDSGNNSQIFINGHEANFDVSIIRGDSPADMSNHNSAFVHSTQDASLTTAIDADRNEPPVLPEIERMSPVSFHLTEPKPKTKLGPRRSFSDFLASRKGSKKVCEA